MKPWLFDILACPIDKSFPLELFIFSFETNSEDFQKLIEIYEKRDLEIIKKEKIIEISEEEDGVFVSDNIVMEKTQLKTYLNIILSSINELNNLFDNTSNILSNKCFDLIKSKVKSNIRDFLENIHIDKIEKIFPELFFLNKIKLEIEISSGLLFCNTCTRWYPIIESIPQMLPDEYRDEKNEINFLQTNKNLMDEKFFKQDLKPYNL
ncbi:MAG: Trm112 family protein [Promethearchaeota archaeon]|jgi:uncharacterized protein YbaR (Trm112 family)